MHPTAFIAPTAVLVGDVTIEERASVWYNAVLRADFQPIIVRRGANVQDCAVVHVNGTQGVEVGPGATIGHNCTVHAAWLGEECLIGNGSTVLDGARIGVRAMVAGGALVTPGPKSPTARWRSAPRQSPRPLAGTPADAGSKPTRKATKPSPSATAPASPSSTAKTAAMLRAAKS